MTDLQPSTTTTFKRYGGYALYVFGALIFAPPAIIWIGGFFFGEAFAYSMPEWFGLWFLGSLVAMCLLLTVSGLLEKFGFYKGETGSWTGIIWWTICTGFFSWILYKNL